MEPTAQQGDANPQLDQDDLNRIVNALPTISTFVVERVKSGKIETEHNVAEATVCGTRPEYFQLLKEVARVELQQGRFFETIEAAEGARIVVLSGSLAKKLFDEADPIDRKVILERQELTVVGVVSDGVPWGTAVTRDAYVPLGLFGPGADQSAPVPYDRFRFRVKTLDQVENTQAIISNIIERQHPDQDIRVHSRLSRH